MLISNLKLVYTNILFLFSPILKICFDVMILKTTNADIFSS